MTEPNMKRTTGGSLVLFDERGTLIGTIERPLRRDPVGPGRDTVYLERSETLHNRSAEAA